MHLFKRDMEILKNIGSEINSDKILQINSKDRNNIIRNLCLGYSIPPLSQFLPTLYRARKNEEKRLFKNLSELWAPPSDFITKNGRFNREKESVLYVSGQPFSAISEIRSVVGDTVTIIACRMKTNSDFLSLAPLAMTRFYHAKKTGPVSDLMNEGPLGYAPIFELFQKLDILDQWKYQDKIIGNLITSHPPIGFENEFYEITNKIKDHIFDTYKNFDGLLYPGVSSGLTSPNVTINENKWNVIEVVEIWVVKIRKHHLFSNQFSNTIDSEILIKLGRLDKNNDIIYENTNKTLMAIWSEFKNKNYAENKNFTQMMLKNPFVRRRISYNNLQNAYDFM